MPHPLLLTTPEDYETACTLLGAVVADLLWEASHRADTTEAERVAACGEIVGRLNTLADPRLATDRLGRGG